MQNLSKNQFLGFGFIRAPPKPGVENKEERRGEGGEGGIFYVFFFDATGIEILNILSRQALLYL